MLDARFIDQLRPLEPGDVSYVSEAVRMLVAELGATPLIGFAGAPFTLASYLVEGGPSRNHEHTKALMYGEPELWDELMRRLASITLGFLKTQIAAGASAIVMTTGTSSTRPATGPGSAMSSTAMRHRMRSSPLAVMQCPAGSSSPTAARWP